MLHLNVNSKAYRKSLLHSLKYPNSYVCGVFIGSFKDDTYTLTDCYPITHFSLINPMLEISLSLIEALN